MEGQGGEAQGIADLPLPTHTQKKCSLSFRPNLTQAKFSFRMPPWGVPLPGPPPATYSGHPTGPGGQVVAGNPLFPSAAAGPPPGSSLFPSAAPGPDRKPTFPAYGE
jgi:hypothetical protein